jgi:tetratricopeptide (TPR) repeat protein
LVGGVGSGVGSGIGNQLPARPGDGNRPGGGGSGDRWRPGDNRPGWANRPGGGGDGDRWRPGDNRPGGGGDRWRPGDNRPGWANRPGNGNNYWANRGNINNGNINRWNQNNIAAIGGGYGAGYGAGYGGYGYGGYGGYGTGYSDYGAYGAYDSGYGYSDYSQPWYEDWYQGNYSDYGAPLAAWSVANSALGWLNTAASNFVYSNPYYDTSQTTVVQPVYNYAEPITVPVYQDQTTAVTSAYTPQASTDVAADVAPTVAAPEPAPPPQPDPKVQAAADAFAAARDAFKGGNYAGAQTSVELAIKSVPDDPVLHEFRALTLFAQGRYQDAAGTVYAVLARGPGWDWNTMRALYPNVDTYTQQLRALEAAVRTNPTDSAARFVLAYHYLVARQTEAAVAQLREVVRLTPKNTLAADMVTALTTRPAAPSTDTPPKPGP